MEKEMIRRAYKAMLVSRLYEEKVAELFKKKVCLEKPLCGIGQEATSVGPVILLKDEDYVVPSLRAKGAFFAKGFTLEEAFLELFRKKESKSRGLWTSHHVADMEKNIVISSAVLASSLPVAAGVALAQKLQKTGNVVVAFFGDGSSSRGDFHAAVNFAAVQDLPIVFVCENNLYALSTPIKEQMKEEDVYKRGVGYGIPGIKADGQNVVEVMELVSEAIERARRGEGPSLIECKTYRYHGHTENHDHVDGRDQEEYDYWFSRDPLKICEEYLIANQIGSEEEIEKIKTETAAEVEEAVENALKAEDADYSDIKKYVYAE